MIKCKNTSTYTLNKQINVLNKHFYFKNKYFKSNMRCKEKQNADIFYIEVNKLH